MRGVGIWLACAAWLGAVDAHAREGGGVPLRVELSAPPGCPSADELTRRVVERNPSVRAARGDESARSASLRVAVNGSAWRATLRTRSSAGVDARELEGGSCDEVFDAAALTLSLVVDALVLPEATPPREPEPRLASLDLGAATSLGAIATLVGPRLALSSWGDPSRGFSPMWRVRVDLLFAPDDAYVDRLLALGGSWCPFTLRAAALRFGPCATAEIGQLRASGRGLVDGMTENATWTAIGPSALAGLTLGPVLFVGEVGASFPVVRPRFTAGPPPRSVTETEAVGFIGALGAGVAW